MNYSKTTYTAEKRALLTGMPRHAIFPGPALSVPTNGSHTHVLLCSTLACTIRGECYVSGSIQKRCEKGLNYSSCQKLQHIGIDVMRCLGWRCFLFVSLDTIHNLCVHNKHVKRCMLYPSSRSTFWPACARRHRAKNVACGIQEPGLCVLLSCVTVSSHLCRAFLLGR